ncbi:unnamed protein product [Closterium sp. Naga37s-1]|nr:unnamed protein product [Closterium sp. Naga37s-1]
MPRIVHPPLHLPGSAFVSASKDRTLRLWQVGASPPPLLLSPTPLPLFSSPPLLSSSSPLPHSPPALLPSSYPSQPMTAASVFVSSLKERTARCASGRWVHECLAVLAGGYHRPSLAAVTFESTTKSYLCPFPSLSALPPSPALSPSLPRCQLAADSTEAPTAPPSLRASVVTVM